MRTKRILFALALSLLGAFVAEATSRLQGMDGGVLALLWGNDFVSSQVGVSAYSLWLVVAGACYAFAFWIGCRGERTLLVLACIVAAFGACAMSVVAIPTPLPSPMLYGFGSAIWGAFLASSIIIALRTSVSAA